MPARGRCEHEPIAAMRISRRLAKGSPRGKGQRSGGAPQQSFVFRSDREAFRSIFDGPVGGSTSCRTVPQQARLANVESRPKGFESNHQRRRRCPWHKCQGLHEAGMSRFPAVKPSVARHVGPDPTHGPLYRQQLSNTIGPILMEESFSLGHSSDLRADVR